MLLSFFVVPMSALTLLGFAMNDFSMLSKGKANRMLMYASNISYDYAAASVIIEEAGGKISRVDGGGITLDKPCSIVGGTETAWREVRAMIKDAGFAEQE